MDRSSAWVWFGLGNGGTESDLKAVRTIMAGARTPKSRSAGPGPGRRGSQKSHRQALTARDVVSVSRAGSPVLAHDDRAVAVAAMLLHDIDSLARWVSAVLGPLAANTRNAERRETLLAFPASGGTSSRPTGCSCTTTPSSTGSPAPGGAWPGLRDDRLDVELALEVVRLLGDVVLR